MLTESQIAKAEAEKKEAERERQTHAVHVHLALRVKRWKKPVQLGLFEPQQLQLI